LIAGYSPDLFWELSLGEVADCIEAYEKKLRRELKQREASIKDEVHALYVQAIQIGNVISHMFDKKVPIHPLSVYYPGLINPVETTELTEQEEEGDKNSLSLEMQLHKARMDDFAFRHNMAMKKRGESGGWNDTGEAASNN